MDKLSMVVLDTHRGPFRAAPITHDTVSVAIDRWLTLHRSTNPTRRMS
jgi:hypothetical protein